MTLPLRIDAVGMVQGALDGVSVVHDLLSIPRDKVYTQGNTAMGATFHSIVGSDGAAMSRFSSTAKIPGTGRYTKNAAASVAFLIDKTELPTQHFPITAATWASSGREPNTNTVAFELEGGPLSNVKEPINEWQAMWVINIVFAIAEAKNWGGVRVAPKGHNAWGSFVPERRGSYNIFEHNMWSATLCCSDRYDSIYNTLEVGPLGLVQDVVEKPASAYSVTDQIIVAMFAGAESYRVDASGHARVDENGRRIVKSFEDRLTKARYRMTLAANGATQSMSDVAASSMVVAKNALQVDSQSVKVEHDHEEEDWFTRHDHGGVG